MQVEVMNYLRARRCAEQWAFFLQALAPEIGSDMNEEERRALMRRTGIRVADMRPLPPCESIEQMQDAANEHWALLDWGVVVFEDSERYLSIKHWCSPLQAAFGDEALSWSAGFLEGVYQQWFTLLGASEALRVTQCEETEESGCLAYRLGR